MCHIPRTEFSNDLESLPLSPRISRCSSCTGKGKTCPFRSEHEKQAPEKSEPHPSSAQIAGSSVWLEKISLVM